MTKPNSNTKPFVVNFIDPSDGVTWMVLFQATSLEEAMALADAYRFTNPAVPNDTEVYTVATLNGSLLWWNERYPRDPVPRSPSVPTDGH